MTVNDNDAMLRKLDSNQLIEDLKRAIEHSSEMESRYWAAEHRAMVLRKDILELDCSYGESPGTYHCPIDKPCKSCQDRHLREKDWHAPNFAYGCCSNGKGKDGKDVCEGHCGYVHLRGCDAIHEWVEECKNDPDLIQHGNGY